MVSGIFVRKPSVTGGSVSAANPGGFTFLDPDASTDDNRFVYKNPNNSNNASGGFVNGFLDTTSTSVTGERTVNYYNGWVAKVYNQVNSYLYPPPTSTSDPRLTGAADSRLSAGESLTLTSTYNGITTLAAAEALVMDYTSSAWPEIFVRWDNTAYQYLPDRGGKLGLSPLVNGSPIWGQDTDWASSQVVPESPTMTVVPEPSAGLGIGLLLSGAFFLRRRK